MPAFLQNPLVLAGIAVAILWLRSNSSNPIVEQIVNILRSLTNTPSPLAKQAVVETDHMKSLVGRVTCAQCLAAEFSKRGKGDVAKLITESVHVLIDEGTVS